MQICEIFRAKIVDVTKRSVVVEVTGTTREGRGVRAAGRRPFG
jgi:acetolactate synthase small subunit